MAIALDPRNLWDNALLAHLPTQGARNPRVLAKRPIGNQQWEYAVAAEAWTTAVSPQFEADGERWFVVWADGAGAAHITPMGYN